MEQFKLDFDDRIAVVTGGAGRIGRPLCEKLASAGVEVAVVDLDAKGAEAEAERIRADGGMAHGYGMDVQSAESVSETARHILADFGRVDILVNNAGVWRNKLIVEMDEEGLVADIKVASERSNGFAHDYRPCIDKTFLEQRCFEPLLSEVLHDDLLDEYAVATEHVFCL